MLPSQKSIHPQIVVYARTILRNLTAAFSLAEEAVLVLEVIESFSISLSPIKNFLTQLDSVITFFFSQINMSNF